MRVSWIETLIIYLPWFYFLNVCLRYCGKLFTYKLLQIRNTCMRVYVLSMHIWYIVLLSILSTQKYIKNVKKYLISFILLLNLKVVHTLKSSTWLKGLIGIKRFCIVWKFYLFKSFNWIKKILISLKSFLVLKVLLNLGKFLVRKLESFTLFESFVHLRKVWFDKCFTWLEIQLYEF